MAEKNIGPESSPESFQKGGFAFVRGTWHYKINQNSTYL